MSEYRINQITNQAGTAGPQVAGITTFSSSSGLVMPRGDTEGRYINYDITNELISKFDAGNLNSYSLSKNSNTWFDLSSNKFTGTLLQGASFTADFKGSILFDGVNDYVNLSISNQNLASLFSTSAVTIISYAKISAVVSKNTAISFNGNFNFFYPGNRLGSTQQLFWDNISLWKGSTNTTWTLNQWYQFAWTIDSYRNLSMYTNGILDSSHALSQDFYPSAISTPAQSGFRDSGEVVRIGLANGTEFATGNVATMQIYNRALTAFEIRQNYEVYRSRFGL